MRIVDTHSHIYQPDFDNDIDNIIVKAKEAGVEKVLLPNIDVATIGRVHAVCDSYPGYCLPMMGLHPTDVKSSWQSDLATIKQQFENRKYVAVGEIGIDLYWDKTLATEQKLAFEEQLRWSIEFGLPVSIHSREAVMECVESIYRIGADHLYGVFHSFGGNEDELKEVLSLKGFYIGINGTVTFKNSALPALLKKMNVDLLRIVVETDAPYLAPVPYRGKRNEPSYTLNIINKLAEIFNLTPEEVGETTSENAYRLFNL